jgi:hypothetical protein
MKTHVKDRLKEIFETTLDSGIKYDGKIKNIDYYSLFCKAASEEKLYKLMGNNLCMFNCKLEEKDAVMMIFFHTDKYRGHRSQKCCRKSNGGCYTS